MRKAGTSEVWVNGALIGKITGVKLKQTARNKIIVQCVIDPAILDVTLTKNDTVEIKNSKEDQGKLNIEEEAP